MNLKDFIVEYDNVLSDQLCDELVAAFEESDRKDSGITIAGRNEKVKVSLDLLLNSTEYPNLDKSVFESFTGYASKYTMMYRNKTQVDADKHDVIDSGYQIQKTVSGGFYDWHHDGFSVVGEYLEDISRYKGTTRFATYLFYLNDYDAGEENGGRTQFHLDGDIISIYPKKGKLLMFPANSLFIHRGEKLKSGETYVMTGWLSQILYHGIQK